MSLAEAIRKSINEIDVVIRRAAWLPSEDIEVGSDAFFEIKDGRCVNYRICPADVLADDWEIREVSA